MEGSSSAVKQEHPEQDADTWVFDVDGVIYRHDAPFITGGEIMDLAGIPRDQGLVLIHEDGTQETVSMDKRIRLVPRAGIPQAAALQAGLRCDNASSPKACFCATRSAVVDIADDGSWVRLREYETRAWVEPVEHAGSRRGADRLPDHAAGQLLHRERPAACQRGDAGQHLGCAGHRLARDAAVSVSTSRRSTGVLMPTSLDRTRSLRICRACSTVSRTRRSGDRPNVRTPARRARRAPLRRPGRALRVRVLFDATNLDGTDVPR